MSSPSNCQQFHERNPSLNDQAAAFQAECPDIGGNGTYRISSWRSVEIGRYISMAELAVFSETNDLRRDFSRDGLLAPFEFLTYAQRKLTLDFARSGSMAAPMAWDKGLAVLERFIFDIATRPPLVELLNEILGEDVILWGASLIERRRGSLKPWHCDVESASPQANFVSVWIGLENAERASGIKFIRHSHRFGRTIQEVQSDHGLRRGEPDDEQVLAWAKEFDSESEIVRPEVSDGDAVLFNGRIWHGSQNDLARDDRTALLLQYARGDASGSKALRRHAPIDGRSRDRGHGGVDG